MYDKNSKKRFTIVYSTVDFEQWQIDRLVILSDTHCVKELDNGIIGVEVYECHVNGIVRGVAKNWGTTPMAVYRLFKGEPVLYPIPNT